LNKTQMLKKIKELTEMKENGIIDDVEFENSKTKILSNKSFGKKPLIISSVAILLIALLCFFLLNNANQVKQYYDNGNLKYEGSFLNGEWSGQGKLYDNDENGTLLYDGGFLNNKFSGQGKAYDKNGTLLYDGGFLNGEMSGQGKMYRDNGQLMYEGSFFKW